MVDVAVICGSASDGPVAEKAFGVLKEHGLSYDYRVISAHRDPDRLDEYVKGSDARVFIAIAGLSAALPGVVASKTKRPVIGVPVSGKLMGIDALLSIVQMPRGVPVACVGIDNGENAALLAVRILGAGRT
ncbi:MULTISPECIES: 5-(carboxyamino)imidazole ribonucleotide mutase [unclassified Methanoculleus]|uniref:5-(carboxyamino)imidazole ribonucleotide mutase n=1 Tax=unclassified Methanoculleus TaxID=2619537 RepID=UPI0025CD0091|nr:MULTISPECIES: 5-(carboxyamino)imidazole ribonucleotide mutase [unclassified Methanoculleus]MCK9319255.1 5-(carboxyamino)imidazole ribonucleotide mutase [Methanoculleus sp.]MDD2254689.1 5-(carboxyamino)imidazole ribonucleotide mutase [Methanoculleus sp.]MDD2787985.1 5-(carboxyamino)imidazole ribonucleotide mutase [Methanoculleus sp.]MDD3217029.1 5-(carboxyamino)imidazole ribonucleotide mutase [Methanoculleus sp.]MDD4315052.1 5-(carboxyamino)imidazole ribonucleotide mutase [Methanoculleus sp.